MGARRVRCPGFACSTNAGTHKQPTLDRARFHSASMETHSDAGDGSQHDHEPPGGQTTMDRWLTKAH
eukprot:11197687-Lingulodinium_polyedra.AAC.1